MNNHQTFFTHKEKVLKQEGLPKRTKQAVDGFGLSLLKKEDRQRKNISLEKDIENSVGQ